MRSSIQCGKGNCQKQDPTDILHVFGDSCNGNKNNVTLSTAALIRKYNLKDQPMQSDHDYADSSNITSLTEYKKATISYIAGYVARMAEKQLICIHCCMALGSKNNAAVSKFLALKV